MHPEKRYATVDAMLTAMERSLASDGGPLNHQLNQHLTSPIDYGELGYFLVAHSDNPELLLPALPKLERSNISKWLNSDADGLLEVAQKVSIMLQGEQGRAGLNQAGLRPPLAWTFDVVRLFVDRNLLDMAEQLAMPFFEALESCDQYPVSRHVAAWFKGLSDRQAVAMIAAAEASMADAYLRHWINDSWDKIQSESLRRWMI